MKKLFLDTNIILDIILEREEMPLAAQILTLGEQGKAHLCVSYLTIANVAYVIRKGRTTSEIRSIISDLKQFVDILPMTSDQLDNALGIDAPDFEDVLQYECAWDADCEIIITRNAQDFGFSTIPVMTPSDYIATLP